MPIAAVPSCSVNVIYTTDYRFWFKCHRIRKGIAVHDQADGPREAATEHRYGRPCHRACPRGGGLGGDTPSCGRRGSGGAGCRRSGGLLLPGLPAEAGRARFRAAPGDSDLSAQNADAGALRSELRLFIDQFSGTLYANQARVALAEIELQRDSLGAAIRVLEPVADLGTGDPLAFTAAGMIGAAYEQAGEPARALRWYERIESNAVFGHQRRAAVAEQARMQMAAGRYAEAITLYETLVAETVDDPGGQQIYSVRLGEARARERFAAAAPVLPIVDGAASVPEGSDGAEEGAGEEPGDTGE